MSSCLFRVAQESQIVSGWEGFICQPGRRRVGFEYSDALDLLRISCESSVGGDAERDRERRLQKINKGPTKRMSSRCRERGREKG